MNSQIVLLISRVLSSLPILAFSPGICYDNFDFFGGVVLYTQRNVRQRNYGIDLLKLVAAFYVVLLHTMIQGGVYPATVPYSYQHYVCRLILMCSFCSVNIFGIVSGYVGYRTEEKPASLTGYLQLWCSVVFYGILVCGIYMVILPEAVTWLDLVTMCFPLSKNLYWYFSAYTLVYFVSPYLNTILNLSSDKTLKKWFFLICLVIVPLEYLKEAFSLAGGYSAMWLLILYLLGAIMKKTGIGSRIPAAAAIVFIIILNFCCFLFSIVLPHVRIFIFDLSFELSLSYVTPFYVASAIAYVIAFSRFRFRPILQKIIAAAAPASLFIYIVNVQRDFWTYFMENRFTSWASGSPAGVAARTIVFSAAFVLAVVFLDIFRRKLFRLLGVQALCQRLSGFLTKDAAA